MQLCTCSCFSPKINNNDNMFCSILKVKISTLVYCFLRFSLSLSFHITLSSAPGIPLYPALHGAYSRLGKRESPVLLASACSERRQFSPLNPGEKPFLVVVSIFDHPYHCCSFLKRIDLPRVRPYVGRRKEEVPEQDFITICEFSIFT